MSYTAKYSLAKLWGTMKKSGLMAAMAAALALGSGCVSINVGKPEQYSREFYGGERPARVVSTQCLGAQPTVDASQLQKGRIAIGLKGEIETKTEKEKVFKTVTVERQKKLDFGLCPAWREMLDLGVKKDSDNMVAMVGCNFDPASKTYENRMNYGFGWTMGSFLGMFLMVPYSTLVEPFAGDYSCSTHHWILPETPAAAGGFIQFFAKETGDREKALEIISSPEFAPLGVKTYVNSGSDGQSAFASQFSHMSLFGFHKRSRVRVLPFEISRREPVGELDVKREGKMAVGPFRVRLAIPALGWEQSADVPKGRSQAWFNDLPDGVGKGSELVIHYEATSDEPVPVSAVLLEATGDEGLQHIL